MTPIERHIKWREAATAFIDNEFIVPWTILADSVQYAYAGNGLYVVRETDPIQHGAQSYAYRFYNANTVEELRKQYYGDFEE